MTSAISFFVPGVPIAQGSKTRTQYGMRESNEAKLKPWRASIVACVSPFDELMRDAVAIEVDFCFPRPRAHYRTGRFAHELKESAPYWHVIKPDADKLMRALGDALAGVVLADDSQIARMLVRKHYGERPGARITISPLPLPIEVGL